MNIESQSTSRVFPCISYRDVPAAIAFLESAFGFEKWMVVPRPDGSVLHAELAFDSSVVMMATLDQSAESQQERSGISIYMAVDDIDAHFRRAKAAGAEIVKEPFDTDYGSRDYFALDIEGYSWFFGTYRPSRPETTSG